MSEGKQLIKIAGITVAVYILMKYFLPYVIPFFISYMLVHLLKPVTNLLHEKLRLKKELILSVLLAGLLIVCSLLFYMLYCVLMDQLKKIAMNFDYYYDCFCAGIDACCRVAERNFGVEMEQMRTFVYSGIEHATEQIRIYIVPGIFNYSMRYLKKAMDAALFLLMVFVAAILLMRDYDRMREHLMQYRLYQHMEHISGRMWRQGGMYLKAQAIIIGIVSILCVLGLWLLGNPYFLLLGIITGLLDALPFIGTGTVLLPVAFFLVLQGSYAKAAGYGILFLITYVAREFLEPRLIGARLGIYPFVMVVVVYAGLYLYGPSGVVLGPVTLLLILVILREYETKSDKCGNC